MITAFMINRIGRITTLVIQYVFSFVCMYAAVPLFGISGNYSITISYQNHHFKKEFFQDQCNTFDALGSEELTTVKEQLLNSG